MMKITNIDPFKNSFTMAGLCSEVFRTNFLKPNTISVTPEGGYQKHEKQSIIALKVSIHSYGLLFKYYNL